MEILQKAVILSMLSGPVMAMDCQILGSFFSECYDISESGKRSRDTRATDNMTYSEFADFIVSDGRLSSMDISNILTALKNVLSVAESEKFITFDVAPANLSNPLQSQITMHYGFYNEPVMIGGCVTVFGDIGTLGNMTCNFGAEHATYGSFSSYRNKLSPVVIPNDSSSVVQYDAMSLIRATISDEKFNVFVELLFSALSNHDGVYFGDFGYFRGTVNGFSFDGVDKCYFSSNC